jgi:hypothetical protein
LDRIDSKGKKFKKQRPSELLAIPIKKAKVITTCGAQALHIFNIQMIW